MLLHPFILDKTMGKFQIFQSIFINLLASWINKHAQGCVYKEKKSFFQKMNMMIIPKYSVSYTKSKIAT